MGLSGSSGLVRSRVFPAVLDGIRINREKPVGPMYAFLYSDKGKSEGVRCFDSWTQESLQLTILS